MEQTRLDAIRARCEAAEDNYKSVRANSELMELFHVDIPDLLAEVARLTAELAAMTVSRDEWQKSAGLHFHKETDALEKLAALKAERDAWKARAEAAELRIKKLERLLDSMDAE